MSATPKKMAQPRNSQPSTFMPLPLSLSARPVSAQQVWDGAADSSLADPDGMVIGRTSAAGVHRGMVQVEGRALGPDPRDGGEVVPRRRTGGRPLQGVAEPPRVVGGDPLTMLGGLVDVVEEEQVRDTQDKGADRRHLIQGGSKRRQEPVVSDASRHAHDTQPVLDQEGHVESDEDEPEVPLAKPLVEHLPGPLWPPEVEAAEHAEDHGAE